MNSIRGELKSELLKTLDRISIMRTYAAMKLDECDWHGCCDACMDLRDLENYNLGLQFAINLIDQKIKSNELTQALAIVSDK